MTKALRNYHGNLQSNFHHMNTDVNVAPPAIELGGGYSSDRQMPTFLPCLKNGTITFTGGSKSVLDFGDSRSFDELEKDLNIDVSASASIGLFSADLSAEYARHVKDTAYTQSFYYYEKVILPTAIFHPAGFGEDVLDPFGKGVYQEGPDQFRSICGDQIVQQNGLGSSLYVALKLHFQTINDKTSFTGKVGVKYGSMFSLSGKIAQVVNENHIKGNIEVSALQVGGDASSLAKIFSSGPYPYAITSCSLEDLSSCQKTIIGVLSYAGNEFPAQINFQNGTVLGSAAIEGYTLMPYTNLGLKVGNSVLTPEVESARKDLGSLYLHIQDKQVFITHIIESSIFKSFFPDIQGAISKISDNLNYNVKLLGNLDIGVMRCYNSPEQCPDVLNDMNQRLQPVDENLIDLIKDSYKFDVDFLGCQQCKGGPVHCYIIPEKSGSSVAMPIDQEGHFHWDYKGNNSTLTIIENSDGTISLGINGNPQYLKIPSSQPGEYHIHHAPCYKASDPIPYPFNTYCYDIPHSHPDGVCHSPGWHRFGMADMTLESIEDVF